MSDFHDFQYTENSRFTEVADEYGLWCAKVAHYVEEHPKAHPKQWREPKLTGKRLRYYISMLETGSHPSDINELALLAAEEIVENADQEFKKDEL